MNKVLPIHSIPQSRMAEMTASRRQQILEQKASRHNAAWWHDTDRAPEPAADNSGCMFAVVAVGCIGLYLAAGLYLLAF